jgi:hypothetical protein
MSAENADFDAEIVFYVITHTRRRGIWGNVITQKNRRLMSLSMLSR